MSAQTAGQADGPLAIAKEALDLAEYGGAMLVYADRMDRLKELRKQLAAITAQQPQPAPELAAAMAETRGYREALEQIAKHHHHASPAVRIIAKIAKRALEAK